MLLPRTCSQQPPRFCLTRNVWATRGRDDDGSIGALLGGQDDPGGPLPSVADRTPAGMKPFVDVTVDRMAEGGSGPHPAPGPSVGIGLLACAQLREPGLTARWYVMASRAKRHPWHRSVRASNGAISRRLTYASMWRTFRRSRRSSRSSPVRTSSACSTRSTARVTRQTQLDYSAAAPSRVAAGSGAGTDGEGDGGRPAATSPTLAAGHRGSAEGCGSRVRIAAVRTLATIRRERAAEDDATASIGRDPRLVATAAIALADSAVESDVEATERALRALVEDTRDSRVEARRDVARLVPLIQNERFRHLLIPLFYDPDVSVGSEAIQSAAKIGAVDALFVPALVSLSRNRLLKGAAREALVGYGEPVLDVMAHFVRDQDEDLWVRRHIPGTLARIPSQKPVDLLTELLERSGWPLRYKALTAIERSPTTIPSSRWTERAWKRLRSKRARSTSIT